ncbi:MAG: hypothetical protein JXR83_21285 [Deltaproteobacteria bacterium]|nr:hypothetical protein [Deltaproteobacteria bacterium]
MRTRVEITESCWRRVVAELDRVAPDEGIAVPLLALTMRDQARNPCAMIELDDIARATIAQLVLVPDGQQVNRVVRVSVLPHTDQIVNAEVARLLGRFPRLRACAYLHSHPFAIGSTRPSRGQSCDYEGHMLPLWRDNRAAGLDTSFSFIACRDPLGRGWRLCCFALDGRGEIVDLGWAQVVADPDASRPGPLQLGVEQRDPLRQVLRGFRRELRRRGWYCCSDELFDGWQRTVVRIDAQWAAAILLPIDFPDRAPLFFLVDRRRRRSTQYHPHAAGSLAPETWANAVTQMKGATHGSERGLLCPGATDPGHWAQ